MVGWLEQAFQTGTLNNIFQRKRLPEKWVCNLQGQEVHWYLILNQLSLKFIKYFRGRFHKKSQFETSFGLSLGLKSETFVSAEFLAQMDFTKGGSAETGLKS